MSADTESLLEMTSMCDQEVRSLRASQNPVRKFKVSCIFRGICEEGVGQSFASAWTSSAVSVKPRSR